MMGRRDRQQGLFAAQTMPHRVPADSFYGRMAAVSDVLFVDDDLAEMYCPDNGRPSLPPSLMSGVTLLQFHDDVSDEEAMERTMFDQRWKVALDLPLDCEGFDPSSLSRFRKRLVDHGQERYAFDRFVAVGRAAGFIPDTVTLLTDTTSAQGAGAVQDTYTLIRKAIRKLLKQLGYGSAKKRRGLSAPLKALVTTYVSQDRKADIDWSDPQQRGAQLKQLVQDAEAALDLVAEEHHDDAEVLGYAWLLTKILGDDIVQDEDGEPQLGQGTAPDRVISVTDPEMRHGRKSRSQRFDGFKVSVSSEPSSDMILDIVDVRASGGDGEHLLPAVQRTEAETGVTVERVLADGAYGSGQNLEACAQRRGQPIDLVTPCRQPADPEVHKSAFDIDLEAKTATCPQGLTVSGRDRHDSQGRPFLHFQFTRSRCEACPLFERCVRSKTHGRSVRTSPYETYLQAQRARQESPEFQALYRQRCRVERIIAELVFHGLRKTRYLGQTQRQLQRLWLAAAVNLKRLFALAETKAIDLRRLLSDLSRPSGVAPPLSACRAAGG
jgi:transposase